MKKNVLFIVAAMAMLLGATTVLWAQLPPPVPQTFGIYDAKFTTFTRDECLGCHVSDAVLVPRHHNLINTKNMACLDCHSLVSDGAGGFVFADFRTCSVCHKTSPHHTSAKAAAQDCQACHGPIDNPLDGHYVPTYAVSSVTPMINGRQVVNPTTNAIVTVQGCAACHQANATAIDPKTNLVRAISSNADTHHGTNIGNTQGGGIGKCEWCHNFAQPGLAIRQCEACHGVKSLHNIQPKVGAPAVPGAEPAGAGHVGANWDCQGCHWSWFGNADQNPAQALIPSLNGQSSYTLATGKATTIVLTGIAFTNTGGDSVVYNPSVTISNGTTTTTLTPVSFTDSEIKVTIPALPEGNYDIKVVKGSGATAVQSNVAKLVIIPPMSIKTAIASKNTVTITGTGFGAAPASDFNSGLGVFSGTTQGNVVSWGSTKVVATFPGIKAGDQVTIKTLNGPVSAAVSAAGKKSR